MGEYLFIPMLIFKSYGISARQRGCDAVHMIAGMHDISTAYLSKIHSKATCSYL